VLSVKIGTDVEVKLGATPIFLQTRHERGILARLATLEGRPVLRDRLAREHWPNVDLSQARLNLRQRLHRLRKEISQHLDVEREWVSLKNFELRFEQNISSQSLLGGLDFEWTQSFGLAKAGLIDYDPSDVEQPLETSVLNRNELRAWFLGYVHHCELSKFPYPRRFSELAQRARAEQDDEVESALWASSASYASIHSPDRNYALDLVKSSARRWRSNPALAQFAALAFENAANVSHNLGNYLDCLSFIDEAERCYQLIGCRGNELRMKFKFHRVQVDMQLYSEGVNGLRRLLGNHGHELPTLVRKLVTDNLIFAFAHTNRVSDADQLYHMAKRASSLVSLGHDDALYESNRSVGYLASGELAKASRSLLIYQDATFNPYLLSDSSLFWGRAAEIFGLADDCRLAAISYGLLQQDCNMTSRTVSPCNQHRMNQRLFPMLQRTSFSAWQDGKLELDSLSVTDAHQMVIEGLTRIAT
jgi:hypothetical protein